MNKVTMGNLTKEIASRKFVTVKDRIEKAKELLKKVVDLFPEGASITVGIHTDGLSLEDFAGSDQHVKIEKNVDSEPTGIRGTADFFADGGVSGTVFFPISEKKNGGTAVTI